MADTTTPVKEDQTEISFEQALFNLQSELDGMEFIKASTGDTGSRKYKYQDLPSLSAQVKPVLRRHGFIWITKPGISPAGEPSMEYLLMHPASGSSLNGEMLLMSKSLTPQDQGSAITYARRYSLTAVLDIVADEDDDAGSAQAAAKAPAKDLEKANIVTMLTKLGKDEAWLEAQVGENLDSMSQAKAREVVEQLKLAVQRQNLAAK